MHIQEHCSNLTAKLIRKIQNSPMQWTIHKRELSLKNLKNTEHQYLRNNDKKILHSLDDNFHDNDSN